MNIKGLIDEDFVNYKEPCMTIMFPYCTFKCERENSECRCQNSDLAKLPCIEVSAYELVNRYMANLITKAICFQGLEPFDSYADMISLIKRFREKTTDPIVIYTGYTMEELLDANEDNNWTSPISELRKFPNVILKVGRYIPNQNPHYDNILGVELISDNQKGVIVC